MKDKSRNAWELRMLHRAYEEDEKMIRLIYELHDPEQTHRLAMVLPKHTWGPMAWVSRLDQ